MIWRESCSTGVGEGEGEGEGEAGAGTGTGTVTGTTATVGEGGGEGEGEGEAGAGTGTFTVIGTTATVGEGGGEGDGEGGGEGGDAGLLTLTGTTTGTTVVDGGGGDGEGAGAGMGTGLGMAMIVGITNGTAPQDRHSGSVFCPDEGEIHECMLTYYMPSTMLYHCILGKAHAWRITGHAQRACTFLSTLRPVKRSSCGGCMQWAEQQAWVPMHQGWGCEGGSPGTGTGATGGPRMGRLEKENPSGCTTCVPAPHRHFS